MKTQYFTLVFFFSVFLSTLLGDVSYEPPPFISSNNSISNNSQLIINNRPLTKINGKVISLYDVVKKMNIFLYEYDPNYSPSIVEIYQFYSNRWETTLDDMIAEELMLLDAEQKEIKISAGEIREVLQNRFGPNVHSNLEKVNLEYEEALDIIRSDLTINQLMGTKVHTKAFQTITPEVIKNAYNEYVIENPQKENWKYQVFSIRGQDKELCQSLSEKAYTLLNQKALSMKEVKEHIELEEDTEEKRISIHISEDYSGHPEKISKPHFDAIKDLYADSISHPVSQISRFDNNAVMRIFHLKDITKIVPRKFEEMHDQLKNQLLYKTFDQEKEEYIKYLKNRFGYDTYDVKYPLPEDYHPFLLL